MRTVRANNSTILMVASIASVMALASAADAQLIDRTLIPNPANEGIAKSLAQQIGAGRGNVNTANSSLFIIKRDPARSVRRGRQIFQRKFSVFQGMGPRTNDGVGGDIVTDGSLGAGLADSCAACHGRPRGSAGHGGDVVTRPDSRDAPHLFGLGLQEMLGDEITTEIREQALVAQQTCEQTRQTATAQLRGRQGEIPGIGSIDYGSITFTASAANGFVRRIDFGPTGFTPASGYVADTGLVFGNRNGLTYGWNVDRSTQGRERNAIADQRFDTFMHMAPGGVGATSGVWEIAVPNGTYHVRIGMGDPSFVDQTNHILVENIAVDDPDEFFGGSNAGSDLDEYQLKVTVSDGRLTIRGRGDHRNPKISFIDVTSNTCTVNTSGVVGVNPDLRVRPFFAQGGTISMREFLVGAFNAEMGLESPDPDLLDASDRIAVVATPAGMILNGTLDAIEAPPVETTTEDRDADGVTNEIPTSIVDHEEFYLLNYFKPGRGEIDSDVLAGEIAMSNLGCNNCHVKDLTIRRDRRVADLETVFNPGQGNPFNRLFSTATLKLVEVANSGTPTIKNPAFGSFIVRNLHADFKRHDMGLNFAERNFNSTPASPNLTRLFITEPLWGVGTTAPYGHDGRSGSLTDVILRHNSSGAEAGAISAAQAFSNASAAVKLQVLKYLGSLILFAPDDTSSSLSPAVPSTPNFPQFGHGAIALGGLFANPADPE